METTKKESLMRVASALSPFMDKALKYHPEKHPSLEHSLSVLLEEVHELKMEVFKKKPEQQKVRDEALDVALTALRLIADNELLDLKRRASWDEYFFDIALAVASRSTCLRRQVGAVAVKNHSIVATGYNGAPRGAEHCGTCIRKELNVPSGERHELCRAVHAEQNLITQANTNQVSLCGSTIYCTNKPCFICCKLLLNAGVDTILWLEDYQDEFTDRMFGEFGTISVKDSHVVWERRKQ